MRWTAAEVLLALAATACGGAGQVRAPAPSYSPGVIEEPITAVLTAALDADQRLQSADSLWDPEATVIANGERRTGPPRFAGVEAGGELAISGRRGRGRRRYCLRRELMARGGELCTRTAPLQGVANSEERRGGTPLRSSRFALR